MKEPTMVKVDGSAHAILKKYKEKLKKKGMRVSLGAAIREMDRLVEEDNNLYFSKKDIRVVKDALDVLKKYKNPTFSDAIRELDAVIGQMGKT